MPKKSKRPRQRSSAVLTLALAVLAALCLGWWLLTPQRPAAPRRHVAVVTPVPPPAQESPSEAPLPSLSPTEAPTVSPTPLAPAATPSRVVSTNGPELALIVDDCGQWIDTERGFLALGVPLTLSVLPDVHYTATIAREASAAGMGVMLHLPMETVSGLNPGPGKVTTEMTDAQIDNQVEDDLAQVPLATGVNNHEGSKASADERVMRDVAGVLAKHGGLFFIDSRTSPQSVGEEIARAQGVPSAGRDVFLDNQESVEYTEAQLREAVAIARRTGSAIAIGHPRPTTLEALKAMIPALQSSGIRFVLAQDLVAR